MMTLFSMASFDNASVVYIPAVKENQRLLVFFLPFMFIVSIAFMNLVTAVIVEKAISSGEEERDMRYAREKKIKEKQAEDLRVMFDSMDEDGDNLLRLDELMKA